MGDTLTAKQPAFVPSVGGGQDSIAVSPDGKSVYVTNSTFPVNSVSQYTVARDGTLHANKLATVAAGNDASGIAVSPDGQSVYVANHGDGTIGEYQVTAKGLVLRTPETIRAGLGPQRLVVSPDGKRVYATDLEGHELLQYSGGNGPGPLAALTPPSLQFGSGGGLAGIAIGPAQIRFSCAGVIATCAVNIVPISSTAGGSTTAVILRTTVVREALLGIQVHRLEGNRRVLIGRFPFGLKHTGHLKIRWDLRVGGRRLRPGHYLVTLRMFDRHGHLIALARPVRISVNGS